MDNLATLGIELADPPHDSWEDRVRRDRLRIEPGLRKRSRVTRKIDQADDDRTSSRDPPEVTIYDRSLVLPLNLKA